MAQGSALFSGVDGFLAIGTLAGFVSWLAWWWSAFLTHYLGWPVRVWPMIARAFGALVLGWIGTFAIELLIGILR
jgi:hypothetical protein